MRVLLASYIEDRANTGMGKWTHKVAEGLRRRGFSTTLWFSEDFPRLHGGSPRAAVLAFPLALAARIAKERARFDAVIVHEPSGFWYGALCRHWRGLPPLVVMCHNVESKCFRDKFADADAGFAEVGRLGWIKPRLFRLWQSDGAIRRGAQVICLSEEDRGYLVERLGVPASKVTLVLNGVDPIEQTPGEREPPSSARVLFVGTWVDCKGSISLPAIWRQVRARRPDAALTLVGTRVGHAEVAAAFAAEDQASLTVIPEVDTQAQMLDHYRGHALFVMPSMSEGSPLAMIEAMGCALPVVAARTGGIPDLAEHGEHALLHHRHDVQAAAEHVVRLMEDPELARKIGLAAQARARTLTWDATAGHVAAVLSKLG
jgi:glycosyltransferase involved in cell wall biosynthesis